MAAIFKRFFSHKTKPEISPEPQSTEAKPKTSKPKKKIKKVSLDMEIKTLEELKKNIVSNGYQPMRISKLFNLFNYQKRSAQNVPKVVERLKDEGLFVCKRDVQEFKWDERVKIYQFPAERLGDLFEDEREMEKAFARNQWYRHPRLNLQINLRPGQPGVVSDQQFSPNGTRDRLDFRAVDSQGHNVVVELKNKDGDKRLIEQVLRYRTDLMRHFNTTQVSCVIITGRRCLYTAKAYLALPSHEKKVVSWYLYQWDKTQPDSIDFIEVPLDFLQQHLGTAVEI